LESGEAGPERKEVGDEVLGFTQAVEVQDRVEGEGAELEGGLVINVSFMESGE
jgi:hypothetical protein